MQDLTVTLVQPDLVWENREANLAALGDRIAAIAEATDVVILPEMFSTGFSMNAAALAETMDGPTVDWMRRLAQQRRFDLVGSVINAADGKYFNRLLWVKPDGTLYTYDKRHLFRMGGEEKVYSSGDRRLLVELNGWRICPLVCYDLRFPAWARNLDRQYEVAIFVANWPERRAAHWLALLLARAIENQAYVIGVNRVGVDGKGVHHAGDSCVIDPRGQVLFRATHNECTQTVALSHAELKTYRESFPAWMDADRFSIFQ